MIKEYKINDNFQQKFRNISFTIVSNTYYTHIFGYRIIVDNNIILID